MAELCKVSYRNESHSSSPEVSKRSSHYISKGYSYKKGSYELESVGKNGGGNGTDSDITPAVVIRHACKRFEKDTPVLEDFNMTVQRGTIYSLLGSSGCGKTTSLQCIVGVRKLDEGNIWVFGARPGIKGNMIGYMPQEISLFSQFSIAETLSYFGTLCGMDQNAAKRQTAFLVNLLRLPEDDSRRVGSLSGGQMRRVSFAVSLIHDPELLILDEPTVGVDPLLRESIWNHLRHMCSTRNTTVLLTTQYIDESRASDCVGVMRNSRLIAENNPALLLEKFGCASLEDVILRLCWKQSKGRGSMAVPGNSRDQKLLETVEGVDMDLPDSSQFIPPINEESSRVAITDSFKRISSLVHKNLTVLYRNLFLFFFSLIIVSIMVAMMCVAFKNDPQHLEFGVVNYEVPNASLCIMAKRPSGECDVENLSCKFIENIPEDVLDLRYYQTEDDALAAVHAGSIWGFMKFPKDYSSIFYERSASGANVDEEVLINSEIVVKMDQTTKNVYGRIKKALHDGFEDYAMSILRDCGFDERQAEFTMNYKTPIFGTDDTQFIQFVAPSITVLWLYFFPIIAAAIRYIQEKKNGTYERSLVAGTKVWEILLAYGLTESIILVLQSILVYIVIVYMIQIEILGSSLLVMILFILSGFGGVSMGFLIGSICNEEIEAALLAMALFFPNMLISGSIWPLEGSPIFMQYFSYVLPCTLTSEAMRSIFSRGWEFTHPSVWPGFLSIMLWISCYCLLTVVVQKLKSK